ncbi:MAG: carboxy-S-adenosyl-L-methionine synthase CmoA [Agriterribacter sp.]
MLKDQVFRKKLKPGDFKFGEQVAKVFDDMVERSVPFYTEIQRMIAEIAAAHAQKGSLVYDLGCSTGTTIMSIGSMLAPGIKIIGVDDSAEMLEKCKTKLESIQFKTPFELKCADLSHDVSINNASVVVLCLTLQFVRPLYREQTIKKIYEGLNSGGILILVEKILTEETNLNREFINYYYDYKRRNNYSEMEISQKREALENVLIPYKLSENIAMLKSTGFSGTETFFKWYNFAGLIAIKK